jgi:hypothetical protein
MKWSDGKEAKKNCFRDLARQLEEELQIVSGTAFPPSLREPGAPTGSHTARESCYTPSEIEAHVRVGDEQRFCRSCTCCLGEMLRMLR